MIGVVLYIKMGNQIQNSLGSVFQFQVHEFFFKQNIQLTLREGLAKNN